MVHQGTDYMETNESSLFRVHQETDYIETGKPSPGTLSRVYQGTDYTNTCTHWDYVSTSVAGTVSSYT